MAFDPDAFLLERAADPLPADRPDPDLPAAPDEAAAPASYALPYGEEDFKSKRARAAQFDPYIELFAKDNPDLPDLADLTRAALLRESGGRTNAESSSGAVGLMQMLPSTYAEQGGKGDPFNTIENIDKGMSYLADQYRKFGSPELALAAYNAGPGNVRKHKGIPPFPETKAYVNAAMGYFQALRGGATPQQAQAAAPAGFDPDAFLAQAKQPEGWNGVMGMGNDSKNTAAVARSTTQPPAPMPQYPEGDPIPPWEAHTPVQAASALAKNPVPAAPEPTVASSLPTGPNMGLNLMSVPGPDPKAVAKAKRQKAVDEAAGSKFFQDQAASTMAYPNMQIQPGETFGSLTPEAAARQAAGEPGGAAATFGDLINAATDYTTGAVVNTLQGKSMTQAAGERMRETTSTIEAKRAMETAKQKQQDGKPLSPDELDLLAHDKGAVQELLDGMKAVATNQDGAASKMALQMVKDLPTMIISGGVFEELLNAGRALNTANGLRKASRSFAYAEKLSRKAAEAKLAKPSAIATIARSAPENVLAGQEIGYAEAKAKGQDYTPAAAAEGVLPGLAFTFMGAPAKIIGSLKDPRPTLKDLRAHPAINEMMPKLQHLLQNPATSDLGFLIRPKDDGTTFWSREDLDRAGYSDREPGDYGPAGAFNPKTGQVTLQKTADASTVMEESIHYLQDKIRSNSVENANPEKPQSQFYTNLQNNINEWEDAVRAEAKRRGVTVPAGDELLGQAMTAHLGYADAYEGTVIPRIAVPDAILEGFNKLLGNPDELRGTHAPGETDIAAASALPEQPKPVPPTAAELMDHAVNVEEVRAKASRASDERKGKMRREMIDLTPTKPKPVGSDDPYAGVDNMVVKSPAADPADAILAALQEHNAKASVDKTAGSAAPVDAAAVNQKGKKPASVNPPKGRKAKVRVPEEDLVISQVALEEKRARDQAFHAAHGPQAAPDVPATPDLPARQPAPGTEGESNFNPNPPPAESPEVTRILNQSGRRPLPKAGVKSETPVEVLHVGQYTADALTRKVGDTPVMHVHPEDRARLGLHKGEALNPQPMNSMAMKRVLGMPVKIDPSAPRLSEVAHTLHEHLLERQQGDHVHIAGADRPDGGTEFHADDLAEALKNRPRHKAALEKEIADAQGRYRSAETRMLEEDQHATEMEKGAQPVDQGYPAEWDEAPKAANGSSEEILFQLKKRSEMQERVTNLTQEMVAANRAMPRELQWPRPPTHEEVRTAIELSDRRGQTRFQLKARPAAEAGLPAGKENDSKAIKAAAKAWKEKGTESPFFKRWFGKSKVVDADGKPRVVYHGTGKEFTSFDVERAGTEKYSDWGQGIYLTPSKSNADYYRTEALKKADPESDALWQQMEKMEKKVTWKNGSPTYPEGHGALMEEWRAARKRAEKGTGGTVMELYASIKNPYIISYQSMPDPTAAETARTKGHDGIFVLHHDKSLDEIVAFSPEQIKSATGNRGTFDPKSPDIRYQLRARKPAEPAPSLATEKPAESPEKKPKGEAIPFPAKKKPQEGAYIPPAAGDMATERPAGSGPRIEERVAKLREAEAAAGKAPAHLPRETRRTWAGMDEEVRQLLMTHGMEHFEHILKTRPLDDFEVQAFDSIVKGKEEEMDAAKSAFETSKPGSPNHARLEAESMAAAAEYAAAGLMQVNSLRRSGLALAAAARVMRGSKHTNASTMMKMLARTIPGVGPKDVATLLHAWNHNNEQFPDLLRAYANPGLTKKVGELYRAGLLSGPATHIRNMAGNTGDAVMRLAETPLGAAIDKALSLKYSGEQRVRFLSEARAEVVGLAQSAPNATRNFARGLGRLFKDEPFNPLQKAQYQIGNIGSGAPGATRTAEKAVGKYYTRPIFKLLELEDALSRDMTGNADLHKLAVRKALQEGKTGKAAWERADAIIAEGQPVHPEIYREIKRLGDERTFREKLGPNMQRLADIANNSALGFLLPFVKTPYNIAKRTIERSPLGFIKTSKEFMSWRKAVDAGASPDEIARLRGNAVDLAARAVAGSSILAGFAALAASGVIGMTGGGPKKPKDKNLQKDSNWQPYSFTFELNGQKHYVPYAWWEPVSATLQMAADIAESKHPEGWDYSNLVQKISSDLLSKTYITSLNDASSFASDLANGNEGAMSKFASSWISSWVPQVVGRAASAVDPVVRDTKPQESGFAGLPELTKNALESKIPYASENLPPKYSPTGKVVEKQGAGVERFMSPAPVSDEDAGKRDLTDAMQAAKFSPPDIPYHISVEGRGGEKTPVRLTGEERAKLAAATDKASKLLERRVKTPFWKSMSAEDQAAEIEQEYKDARDDALDRITPAVEKRSRAQ